MADADVMKMKVADLKRELRIRGLPTTGNKTELQERLQSALIDGELSLEDAGISEDLLDEDGLTDEEEKAALDSPTDESVLISPSKVGEEKQTSSSTLIPSQQQQQQQQQQSQAMIQSKKVVLKRKNSLTLTSTNQSTKNNITTSLTTRKENSAPLEKIPKLDIENNKTEDNNNGASQSDQKKVIKLSELSLKERLEMRAKKFGTNASSISGGGGSDTDKSNVAVSGDKEQQQIQTLKKRAERFGCVISSKIADIEKQEKLLKRQQRFGSAPNNSESAKNGGTSSLATDTYAEKAKLRLERFKTTPPTPTTTK